MSVGRQKTQEFSWMPLAEKQYCDFPVLWHGLICNQELCFGPLFTDAELLDFVNASSAKKSLKMQML